MLSGFLMGGVEPMKLKPTGCNVMHTGPRVIINMISYCLVPGVVDGNYELY